MSLRRVLLCLALSPLSAHAQDAPEQYLSPAEGHVVVAPDGSVEDVKVRTPLGDDIVSGIEAMVAKWRFEPLPAGARPAHVNMKLMLAARIWPGQDRTQIGVQTAHFTYAEGRNRPIFALSRPIPTLTPPTVTGLRDAPRPVPAAQLTVVAHLDAQGRPDHVELVQGWHISAKPDAAEHVARWQELFMEAIRAASASWVIPGHGEGGCVVVPVSIQGPDPLWSRATAMQPAPLSGPCATAFDTSVLRGVADINLVTPVRPLLPEVWAKASGAEMPAAGDAASR